MQQKPAGLITPHGGELKHAVVRRETVKAHARDAVTLPLDAVGRADLEMLAQGAYSPLTGFQTNAEREHVARDMRLPNGTVWPIPITLGLGATQAPMVHVGHVLRLAYDGETVGTLTVSEVYERDPVAEAKQVFGTDDSKHPGVAQMYARGPLCVAGQVQLFDDVKPVAAVGVALTPQQSRMAIEERGWQRVVGFQTRNPIHRAHEYILKCAMEISDGLLLHPLVGATKDDDVPAAVRLQCYEAMMAAAWPADRVLLSCLPAPMRYAGPREAVLHALIRQNYGCSHFIVGRDHAGVGNYYGTYDAQRIFDQFDKADIAIQTLFFEHTFFCRKCEQMASAKTCPHATDAHVILSGTKVREMLRQGERPPPEFTRAAVADVLIAWARS